MCVCMCVCAGGFGGGVCRRRTSPCGLSLNYLITRSVLPSISITTLAVLLAYTLVSPHPNSGASDSTTENNLSTPGLFPPRAPNHTQIEESRLSNQLDAGKSPLFSLVSYSCDSERQQHHLHTLPLRLSP